MAFLAVEKVVLVASRSFVAPQHTFDVVLVVVGLAAGELLRLAKLQRSGNVVVDPVMDLEGGLAWADLA